MIDLEVVRKNPQLVKQKSAHKQVDVDVDKILELDKRRLLLLRDVEDLRAKKNNISTKIKNGKPASELIEKAKEIKASLSVKKTQLTDLESNFHSMLREVPNLALDHVPVGETEKDNVVTKTVGDKPKFNFTPKTHWELAEERGLFDKKRAAKISGSRFVYLKGNLVRLQFAIVQFVIDKLCDETVITSLIKENNLNLKSTAFTPVIPPALLKTEPYMASARLNAKEMTYKLEDDNLWLNASAEHTLCTMYWNEILPVEELPIRYIGYSTSFRREAGTYGKDTEGIIRLHQFDKLEMEVFSTPDSGLDEHKLLIAIQEHLVQQLELPYRFIQKSTADIGKPNASGVDIDCWFPGQQKYIETHTADYMTDFQARDLKTRTKIGGENTFVHTNDATAFAMSRILAAIIENYQQEEGSIKVPKVLQKYLGGIEII